MISVNIYEVSETYNTIEHERLDVRTITLGIGLLECMDNSLKALSEKIHKKATTPAKSPVSTSQDIEADFGIPIVSERISVTPTALVGGSACRCPGGFVTMAKTLDVAVGEMGVNLIGGYSALVGKGMTKAGKNLILSVPQALSQTERVCSSVNIDSTKTGIDMDTVGPMDKIITETAGATRNHDSLSCAKLVISCNAPDDNPLMANAFHDVTESEAIVNTGVSGPGVAKVALAKARDANLEVLCEATKKTASKIIRVGQLVAQEASRHMGILLGIIDLSLAPTPSVGDSVAEILEEIGLKRVGVSGIATALAMLNDQVRKGGVMMSLYVDGLSGAFIPVSEGQRTTDAVNIGVLTIRKLETTTCVCSVGLDIIAIPDDTPFSTVAGIIANEAAIRMVNQKTAAVRLIPVVGKKAGEIARFGRLLGYASITLVDTSPCRRFATRDGKIPAPIHSFKN